MIIGTGFTNAELIQEAADTNTSLHYSPHTQLLIDIMASADIALSTGGQTLYELLGIGIPTIAFTVAKNQKPHVDALSSKKLIIKGGKGKNIERIEKALRYLASQRSRSKLASKYSEFVNLKGSLRAVSSCKEESHKKIWKR